MNIDMPFTKPFVLHVFDRSGSNWAPRNYSSNEILLRPVGSCSVTSTVKLSGRRLRLTAAQRASIEEGLLAGARQMGAVPPILGDLPTDAPWYNSLQVDTQGKLWVERPTSDRTAKIEVYSPSGELVAEIADGVSIRMGGPVIIAADHSFTRDNEGVAYLVAHRMVR